MPVRSLFLAFASFTATATAQAVPKATAALAVPSIPRAAFLANMNAQFARMDANHDGKVTKPEIEAFQRASELQEIEARNHGIFAQLDSDHNGQLSPAEFARFHAQLEAPNGAPMLQRFDKDRDGTVTAVEFRLGTLANFDKLDTDADGIVTPTEMKVGGVARR